MSVPFHISPLSVPRGAADERTERVRRLNAKPKERFIKGRSYDVLLSSR